MTRPNDASTAATWLMTTPLFAAVVVSSLGVQGDGSPWHQATRPACPCTQDTINSDTITPRTAESPRVGTSRAFDTAVRRDFAIEALSDAC